MFAYKPLFEHTIFLRQLFSWCEKLRPANSLAENICIIREFEYKRSKVLGSTSIIEKKKENILSELDRRLKPIYVKMGNILLEYKENLENKKINKNLHLVERSNDIKKMNEIINDALSNLSMHVEKDTSKLDKWNKDLYDMGVY